MIHISLFDGIGGFLLAAEGVGWKPGLSSEIDPFCKRVLKHHFPNIYHHGDIHTLNYGTINTELSARFGDWRRDGVVLTGGFPCQGFSTAGKRLGTNDNRYLWPQMLRVIQEVRPDWVVGENVAGILSMEDESGLRREVFAQVEGRKITRYADFDHYEGIHTRQAPMLVASIIEDLEKEGYEVQAFVVPAASVGAPHRRDRIWFVAHRSDTRIEGLRGQEVNTNESINAAHADGEQRKEWTQDGKRPDNTEEGAGLEYRPSRPSHVGVITHANGERQSGGKYREAESGGFTKIGEKWNSSHATSERMERDGADRLQEPSTPLGEGLFGRDHAGSYWEQWPTQPPICSGNDGIPGGLVGITFPKWREQSIKALGNAIVPQVAFEIFRSIEKVK